MDSVEGRESLTKNSLGFVLATNALAELTELPADSTCIESAGLSRNLLGVLDRVAVGLKGIPERGVMFRGAINASVRSEIRPLTGRREIPTLYSGIVSLPEDPTAGGAGSVPYGEDPTPGDCCGP